MSKARIVLDANIIIKLFHEERDTHTAQELLEYLMEEEVQIIAPQLIITETLNVCLTKKVSSESIIGFFDAQLSNTLEICDLEMDIIKKACEITESGHPKSGFPGFNDSVYHATALLNEAIFITADDRHLKKADKFGAIFSLTEWRRAFSMQ